MSKTMRCLGPILLAFILSFNLNAQINFNSSGLSGVSINNPTSLQFGPDDRLYVSVQSGEVYAYTIQRNGPGSYQVLQTEQINLVKNIRNHNDDGTFHPNIKRQVTGLLAAGTPTNPVLYVTSSDYRIGGGGGGSDKNLDSNSGIISKLSWDGTKWVKVDLVRGLPRSEENHATNGLQLDPVNNILYVASGGHTNAGAPSNNFAFLTEYALSAAILTVDLDAINAMPVLTDPDDNSKYVYDLPTLDDPTRANANGIADPNNPQYDGVDVNDPFGGNDGMNQAKWVANGPVQVYASGFRNAYDVVFTSDQKLYTWDNGANAGWGGHPDNEGVGTATNNWVSGEPGSTGPGPNDGQVNNKDGLHYITGNGYYGGHPNPVRANPSGAGLFTHDHLNGSGGQNGVWRTSLTQNLATTLPVDWPPVDLSLAHPIEGDFQNAGVSDQSLYTVTASTNGITEYTASNFNGLMQGNLLAASFNGNIYRVNRNASGSINGASDVTVLASGFGSVPLDVTAQGDGDVFPGTIWAATYGSNIITVFEPMDFTNCSGVYDNSIDEDNDGYTNADELDNQTDPCNNSSAPNDFDKSLMGGFKVSDLNDPDDDDDGINDLNDYFAIDSLNGQNTNVGLDYPLLNGDPGFGFFGLGFTGFMNNGQDYLSLLKDEDNSPTEIIAGGAVGLLSLNDVFPGSPKGNKNNLTNAFQFGLNASANTLPFEVEVGMLGPIFQGNHTGDKFHGFYIGKGDQDNFIMLAAEANNGNPILKLYRETGGVADSSAFTITGLANAAEITLYLEIDPISQTMQPRADIGNGKIALGNPINMGSMMLNILNSSDALAIGLAAGKSANAPSFNATWDFIRVNTLPNTLTGQWSFINDGNNCQTHGNGGVCMQARHKAGYVQVGDKFVLLGGRENNSNVNIYNPADSSWSIGANAPFNMHHFQALEYEGLVYVLAGMTGAYPSETPLSKIYVYDVLNDTWRQGPSIPQSRQRGAAGAVVYNNKFYLVGGITNGHLSGWVSYLDEFDPATNTWTALTDAPKARDHFQAAVHSGKLYLAGGRRSGSNGTFADMEAQVDVYDFDLGSWSTTTALPTLRAAAQTAVVGNELIVIGGENTLNTASPVVEALNLSTGQWRTLDSLNIGRHGTQAIVNNGGIYVASGSPNKGGGKHPSQEVFFFGNATPPLLNAYQKGQLASSKNSLNFAQVQPGNTASQTLYLKNINGNQAILIDSVSLADANAPISVSSTYGLPYHLSPGDSLALNVSFTAGASGITSTTLLISNSGSSALNIPLTGESQSFAGIYINCGGSAYTSAAGKNFIADQYFQNGKDYSSNQPIANTPDQTLYQSERYAPNLSYAIPLPGNGSYEISLHLAEIYFASNDIGKRVFDIEIEGTTVQSNFDILANTSALSALVKTYRVDVTDGELNIQMPASVNNAKLAAISIEAASDTITVDPISYYFQNTNLGDTSSFGFNLQNASTFSAAMVDSLVFDGPQASDFYTDLQAGDTVALSGAKNFGVYYNPQSNSPVVRQASLQIFVNSSATPLLVSLGGEAGCAPAGSSCDDGDPLTINDVEDGNCNCAGTPSNSPFSLFINAGGPAYTATDGKEYLADQYFVGGNTYQQAKSIANTTDDALYQTERYAPNLVYNIPVPKATVYRITLHLSEIFSGAYVEGARIFSVSLEDSTVLQDFDIFKTAGPATAYTQSFDIAVNDGVLNLSGLATVDNAKLSAIGIEEQTQAIAPTLSPCVANFNPVFAGGSDSLSLSLSNPNNYTLFVDSASLSGSHASDFQAMVNAGDSIAANASLNVLAIFSPQGQAAGVKSAVLSVYIGNYTLSTTLNGSLNCDTAGTACDDGNSLTYNDVEDGNCNCAGTIPDVVIHSPADGDSLAFGDFFLNYSVSNWPVGSGISHFHQYIDGQKVNTLTDTLPILVNGLAAGTHNLRLELADASHNEIGVNDSVTVFICDSAGTPCDDGDTLTTNDVYDGACNCSGTPLTPTPTYSLNINCGGSSYLASDGAQYIADQHFLSGKGVSVNNSISGTNDETIFKSNRYGKSLQYAIPLPDNGQYTVTLHFAETWKGGWTVGKRVFDLMIENQLMLSNLDIYAVAGANTALSYSFVVNVNDSVLNITADASSNNGQINAIQIRQDSAAPAMVQARLQNSSLTFGATTVGNSDSTGLQIQNYGTVDTRIDSLVLSGNNPVYFRHNAPVGDTIVAGNTSNFTVWFDALNNALSTPQATLSIYLAGKVNPLVANLQGQVVCPAYGTPCDDGDSTTTNDIEDGNCNCAGSTAGTPPSFSLNINCGGASYTNHTGSYFMADDYFVGGSKAQTNNAIAATVDDVLFQSNRYAKNLQYAVPVPNGTYTVKLHFAETWAGGFTVGKRVFDLQIEGAQLLNDFDIYAATGANTALTYSFEVAVFDGEMNINANASSNNAQINAIEILGDTTSTAGGVLARLSSNAVNFGNTTVGSTKSSSLSLINYGSQNTAVDSVKITGSHTAYFSHNLQAGTALTAGANQGFSLYFDALNTQVAQPQANLEVYLQGLNAPLVASLSGTISCPAYGTPCNDGDSTTINDIEDGNCNCAGTPQGNNPSLFSLAINSGGNNYTAASGKTFVADNYAIGGATSSTNATIANTVDPYLYQTNRYGKGMGYEIPVPKTAQYDVTIHFSENWPGGFKTGARVFDVLLENNLILSSFDIYDTAGARTAMALTFRTQVSDGKLSIQTSASVNNSQISALEIMEVQSSSGKRALATDSPLSAENIEWSVYPNPLSAEEPLHLRWNTALNENLSVELFSLTGQSLQQFEMNGREKQASLALKHLPRGTYLLRINGIKTSEVLRIVIK